MFWQSFSGVSAPNPIPDQSNFVQPPFQRPLCSTPGPTSEAVYRYPTDIASRDPRTRGDRHSIPLARPFLLQRPDDLSQEDRFPRPCRPGEKDRSALINDHVEHVALFRGEDDFLANVEGGVGVGASGGGEGWKGDLGCRAEHATGCRN